MHATGRRWLREGDLFSSNAALLASGCVPAVVAMQFPISDEAAKRFSAKFYGSLAEGFPVHQAVARARMELMVKVLRVDLASTLYEKP